jgi:hypothetical protein
MCKKNVLDSSEFCPTHRMADSKTLFNFYPWFKQEGYPEFEDETAAVDPLIDTVLQDAVREVRRVRNARRAAVKSRLMEILVHGKPGDILTREDGSMILGVGVAPGEPGYQLLRTVIRKYEDAFVLWGWVKDRNRYECD